jgi:hypothetical protein
VGQIRISKIHDGRQCTFHLQTADWHILSKAKQIRLILPLAVRRGGKKAAKERMDGSIGKKEQGVSTQTKAVKEGEGRRRKAKEGRRGRI